MQCLWKWTKLSALALAVLFLPNRTHAQHYTQKNLISDIPGMAAHTDPNLKNPWGITRSPSGSPWWIANNNSGTSTLEDGAGNPINIFVEANGSTSNFVVVPPPGFAPPGTPSTPTGIVFNSIPRDFAPFNIQNIGGSLFVTYAKQDALRHDDVPGDGLGFVDIFSTTGKFEGRLEHGDWFNAPWGVVWTPRDFGEFSNVILVGNFGSGWIAAFNGFTKKFIGFVRNPDNSLVFIDGLWSLTFGNNGVAGSSPTLFFSAGINGEQDGLFGTLTPIASHHDDDADEASLLS